MMSGLNLNPPTTNVNNNNNDPFAQILGSSLGLGGSSTNPINLNKQN